MYTGPIACPRCEGTHWHRNHIGTLPTGTIFTELVCMRCSEKLLVRSAASMSEKCLVCRRWTLYDMGKLRPQYREWVHGEPQGTPVYKGGK